MVCGMTTTERTAGTTERPRRTGVMATVGALLTALGTVMFVGGMLATSQGGGNGSVLIAGAVLLVGGLRLQQESPRGR